HNSNCDKVTNHAKSDKQRAKEYRQRKKVKLNEESVLQQPSTSTVKTNRDKCKEYREREKIKVDNNENKSASKSVKQRMKENSRI
ncbi:hypothetical protein ACUWCL_28680, partial [Klebsiella pneumoniae]|uniref:hypothetical protein n=1 Tax=Klebsiella pneumoniae TaxID=573 RepID=UPI0040556960